MVNRESLNDVVQHRRIEGCCVACLKLLLSYHEPDLMQGQGMASCKQELTLHCMSTRFRLKSFVLPLLLTQYDSLVCQQTRIRFSEMLNPDRDSRIGYAMLRDTRFTDVTRTSGQSTLVNPILLGWR